MNEDSHLETKISDEEKLAKLSDSRPYLSEEVASRRNIFSKSVDSNINFNHNEVLASDTFASGSSSLPIFHGDNLYSEARTSVLKESLGVLGDQRVNKDGYDKCRSVTGQESGDLSSNMRKLVESVPRERKRWVRPPGVGQATSESPGVMQDLALSHGMKTKISSDRRQMQSEDEAVPHILMQSEDVRKSGKNAENVEVTSDIKNSYYFNPTLGSTSNNNNSNVEVPNEIKKDEKFTKIQDIYKRFISAKSPVFSVPFDIQSVQDSTIGNDNIASGRAPSPASVSSVTSSRRLEWDSGADVGYQTYHTEENDVTGENFSTIERIALARGCSTRIRMDPEGIAGSVQNLPTLPSSSLPLKIVSSSTSNSIFKTPLAVSTPLESETVKSSTGTDSESDIMPVVKMPRELYFFSLEQDFDNPQPSQENIVNVEHNHNTNKIEENFLSRKISSSLTDLSECGRCEEHKNTNSLPRTQSHMSLLLEENKPKNLHNVVNSACALRYQQKKNMLNACSASSSSIATVVPKPESPRVLDKLTQTTIPNISDRHSVAVQVFESRNASECGEKNTGSGSVEEQLSESDIINDTINTADDNGYRSQKLYDLSLGLHSGRNCADRHEICKGAHKRTYVKKHRHSLAAGRENDIVNSGLSDAPKEKSKNSNTHSSENRSENLYSKSDSQWTIPNEDEIIEKYSGTLDSIPSSTHTAGSWTGVEHPHGNISSRRDSSGVVGSANSFEYLPGHVYESNASAVDQKLYKNTIPEDSSSQSASSHLSLENRLIKNGSFWDDSPNSTLKDDLEKGVNLLKGLLDSKSYSSSSKKKLIRMLVNRLVVTDYAEDSEMLQDKAAGRPVSWRSDNVERIEENTVGNEDTQKIVEREEISGESAGEQQIKNKPQQKVSSLAHFVVDKCVGTVSSERSGLSSTSDKVYHSDAYAESRVAETSTTGGQDGSSSSNTISSKKSCSWKDYTTQSEREYEQHNSKNLRHKSVLLKLCETERENQLSWISTEIHHLNNLKQLLEKQQKLNQSLSRREMQERGNQKMKNKSAHYQKNSSAHSSLQSESRCQSSISSRVETPSGHEERNTSDDLKENSSFKEPKNYKRREHYVDKKEVQKSPSKKNVSITKSISTQIPSSINVNDTNTNVIPKNITRDNFPSTDSGSVSYSLTFEVTAGALSDGTAGRINVYGHTKDGNSGKAKHSSKISDDTENKRPKKCSPADINSKSSLSDSKENSLCCCECRKLLDKVISDVKHSYSIKNVADNKRKISHLGVKYDKNKNFDYKSSNSCTISSSETLRNTPDLNLDSDGGHYSPVTTGKVSAQTKKSTNPQRENSIGKQLDTKETCPCCGMDQEVSSLDNGSWKCVRCMKLNSTSKVKRCQICGILESEQIDIPDYDLTWKCNECLRKELQGFEKCVHCRKKQELSNNKEVESQSNTVSSETHAPTSLGYILTLDTSARSNSSPLSSTKIPLQEIKIKIPRKSRQSVSAKEKTQEKLKKNIERSRPKTSGSKENKKPVVSSQNKSKHNQKHTFNVEERHYTLQEYLEANRPDFIRNAEYRRQCLDEIAYLRELRQNSKHKLLAIASYPNSHLDAARNTQGLPPPPLALKRVFSQRTLRAQTERKYHNLPEVLNKKAEKKRKEDYRTNRLMAEIFAKKLQRKALKGEVNLSNSMSVISNI